MALLPTTTSCKFPSSRSPNQEVPKMNPRYEAETERQAKAKRRAIEAGCELATAKTAAALFSVSHTTIREAHRKGLLESEYIVDIGTKPTAMFRLSSLIDYFDGRNAADPVKLSTMRKNGVTFAIGWTIWNVLAETPAVVWRGDASGMGQLADDGGALPDTNEMTRSTLSKSINTLANDLVAVVANQAEPMLSMLATNLESLTRRLTTAAPYIAAVARDIERLDVSTDLLKQGWVPNRTTPFDLVAECGNDSTKLQKSLISYYTKNWGEIRTRLEDAS